MTNREILNTVDKSISDVISNITYYMNNNEIDKSEKEDLKKVLERLEKALKHGKKSLKLINKTNIDKKVTNKSKTKTTEKSVKAKKKEVELKNVVGAVKDVKFMNINPVDIDSTVGELPVLATIKSSGRFDCKVRVNKNKTYTLLKGSILCIGMHSLTHANKEWYKLRVRLRCSNELLAEEIEGFKAHKLLLKRDVNFESQSELLRFILGRELNNHDKSISINVGNITLSRYLKMGNMD